MIVSPATTSSPPFTMSVNVFVSPAATVHVTVFAHADEAIANTASAPHVNPIICLFISESLPNETFSNFQRAHYSTNSRQLSNPGNNVKSHDSCDFKRFV